MRIRVATAVDATAAGRAFRPGTARAGLEPALLAARLEAARQREWAASASARLAVALALSSSTVPSKGRFETARLAEPKLPKPPLLLPPASTSTPSTPGNMAWTRLGSRRYLRR